MSSNWNESYEQDFIPWDTGVPEPMLIQVVESGVLPVGGRSTWGAAPAPTRSGWRSTASRFWAWTLRRWRSKRRAPSCRRDCLAGSPLLIFLPRSPRRTVSAGFRSRLLPLFDEPADRAKLAAQVAAVLAPDGIWLSLIGSTERPPREMGPPRRSLRDVADAIEPHLEILSVRSAEFRDLPE
jgi:hypothetical protein